MKIAKIIGVVVLVIIAILGIVIALQPSHAHIEKSISINAPTSVIFPEVSNYRNFNEWSPWSKMDPDAEYTYEGIDGTVGAKMNWEGEKSGEGSQWIIEIEENQRVKNRMTFGGYEGEFYSEFRLEPNENGTTVVWTYDGPNQGLAGKAAWVIMGTMLSSQYDQGLRDLKKRVEDKTAK